MSVEISPVTQIDPDLLINKYGEIIIILKTTLR